MGWVLMVVWSSLLTTCSYWYWHCYLCLQFFWFIDWIWWNYFLYFKFFFFFNLQIEFKVFKWYLKVFFDILALFRNSISCRRAVTAVNTMEFWHCPQLMTQKLVFCNCNRARLFICSILNLKQSLNLKPQVHIHNTKSWPFEICLCLYARKTSQNLGSNDFLKFNWKIDVKFVEVASARNVCKFCKYISWEIQGSSKR